MDKRRKMKMLFGLSFAWGIAAGIVLLLIALELGGQCPGL